MLTLSLLTLGAGTAAVAQAPSSAPAASKPSTKPARAEPAAERQQVERNLETFDDLDYRVFSGQQWQDLHKSHGKDIVVHWPDGRTTKGIDKHIEDLKAMFTYAPDTRIKVHPVKFGSGEWTAVIGEMEGTFTKPMTMPDGTVVQPTGKAYKIKMATIGRWTNGVMVEEHLFWDNQTFMKQLGLAR